MGAQSGGVSFSAVRLLGFACFSVAVLAVMFSSAFVIDMNIDSSMGFVAQENGRGGEDEGHRSRNCTIGWPLVRFMCILLVRFDDICTCIW